MPVGTNTEETIASKATGGRVEVGFEGFSGENHSGLNRESCVRVKDLYAEGTRIRNTRQISIVADEELALIARGMEIGRIEPEWLGANLLVAGIPHLTLLPPSSRLLFSSGACLVVDMENRPCAYPAKEIQKVYPGKGRLFIKNARQRRGVTAWVEKEGAIADGDGIRVFMPNQPRWPVDID
ncbi:MAG: MOSC domain-containing protein [Gammaproteobacteria bacterium]|nr:MAG: MOSC domain-containing protein [Gammaproteobacteria bacterium]